jgi:hypothetical protein
MMQSQNFATTVKVELAFAEQKTERDVIAAGSAGAAHTPGERTRAPSCSPPRRRPPGFDGSSLGPSARPCLSATKASSSEGDNCKVPRVLASRNGRSSF